MTVFRVDNPHTKPFALWEWLIGEIKQEHPETIFLSEAFTRPRVMHRLAKLGFSQSYTYFTWRNTAPGTDRVLHRADAAPVARLLPAERLAEHARHPAGVPAARRPAGLHDAGWCWPRRCGANYGIYGPAFELLENEPRTPGSEEYLDSEKYEITHRDLSQPHSLEPFITRVNRIRRENPALHENWNLRFCPVDNDALICYYKATDDGANIVLTVVNLDPHHVQSGWVDLPLQRARHRATATPSRCTTCSPTSASSGTARATSCSWIPRVRPAHIFLVRKQVRSERDFDYFL